MKRLKLKRVIAYSQGLLAMSAMITCMYVGAIIYAYQLRPVAKQSKHSWNN